MDLKHLKALVAIADAGSITRASTQLNVVQPALSNQIKSLEDGLGERLFARSPQGVTLTDAGNKLYSHAKKILKLVEEAVYDVKSIGDDPIGTTAIGCQNSLSGFLAINVIGAIRREYPSLIVDFRTNNSAELYNATLSSKLDMAITYRDMVVEDKNGKILHKEALFSTTALDCHYLFKEELYLCSASNKSNTDNSIGQAFPLDSLSSIDIIAPPFNHGITQNMCWIASENNIKLNIVAHTDSVPVMLSLVEAGLGHCLIPASASFHFRNHYKVQIRRFEDYRIVRTVVLCSGPLAQMCVTSRVAMDVIKKFIVTPEIEALT